LRFFYGPKAVFKSEEQEHLCEQVLAKERHLVAVIPTGGGKSLSWLMAAAMDRGSCSVVVVPFKQLLLQHFMQAREYGLEAVHWEVKCGTSILQDASLVFVALETAKSPKLKQ
jgi:superfamily II DNA helicase RecQ